MKTYKWISLFVLALSTSAQAGKVSIAIDGALEVATDARYAQRFAAAAAVEIDMAKAVTEGIKIPVGTSKEMTLFLTGPLMGMPRNPSVIVLRMNSETREATSLMYRIEDEAVSDWAKTRSFREPISTSDVGSDRLTFVTINTQGDATYLAKFIIAAAERYGRQLQGATGL